MKTYIYKCTIFAAISGAILLTLFSCKDNSYGTNTDIDFPVPSISQVTLNPTVGDTITIEGDSFAVPNTLTIDGISMKILSDSDKQIVAVLPRIFSESPIIIRNAYGRYSVNGENIQPIYPPASAITVTTWPTEIIRGRPLAIRGTNMDLVTQVVIGSTVIDVNGLTQQRERLLVQIPTSVAETQSTILLKTVVGSTIESTVLPIIDYDPTGWTPIDPVVMMDFEDGIMHYYSGDLPNKNYTAQIDRSGIIAQEGNHFFSLYADVNDPYNMWTYLGSLKMSFSPGVDMSVFHDPYISFLWNSSDNIGAFQLAVTQGTQVGSGTFAPGKTDNPNDAYTLRPTNGQWQWVSVRLKDFLTDNWGGGFSVFDNYGEIDNIELVFKQINGVYWNGTWGSDVYNYNVQANRTFKANIDQIMITDGPYPY